MIRTMLLALALLPAGSGGNAAQTAPAETAPVCATVDACIARLRAAAEAHDQVGETVRQRLAELGPPAVDALVPLLMDPDPWVRESAGLALTYFDHIDSRHLPALVEAWRHGDTINHQGRGNGWLPRPIAATGTEEALRLLWADYERDPQQSRNSQTFFALAWGFPERVRPLLLARFAACRDSDGAGINDGDYRGPCAGLYTLLQEFRPPFPDWSIPPLVDLAEHARSDDVRAGAESVLAGMTNPAALAPLQRRLAALTPALAHRFEGQWDVRILIREIARYGPAARASGPAITPYLGRDYGADLRADAALALGQIDAQAAIPALLALEPDLGDDWLLAYNVAEALGRLRARAAVPLLQRLASGYWHRGVRHNAARALNAIAGGPFADPERPGDGAPYGNARGADGQEYEYFGDLRFAGDDAAETCLAEGERRFAQDPVGALRPPAREPVELRFAAPEPTVAETLRSRIPQSLARGGVMFALPVRNGTLVGLNGGEFGGGLVLVPDQGPVRKLMGEPVAFAWHAGARLYVAAGLAHLVLDLGHIYVIDPVRLAILRTIRLPASPRGLYVTRDGAAVIDTAAGQVAVGADGRLVDVERLHGCMAG